MTPNARPTVAFSTSLAGGTLIVVGSVLTVLFGVGVFVVLAAAGLAFGLLVILSAVFLYIQPAQHAAWGVAVVLFSALGLVGFGGFVAGTILGVVGGSLGITWQSGPRSAGQSAAVAGPYGVPLMPWRLCMGCGRWIPWAYNVCPLCGTQAPVATWVAKAGGAAPPPAPPYAPAHPGAAQPAPIPYASPPPAPEPVKAPCPTCTGEAVWSALENRWYCPAESRYF